MDGEDIFNSCTKLIADEDTPQGGVAFLEGLLDAVGTGDDVEASRGGVVDRGSLGPLSCPGGSYFNAINIRDLKGDSVSLPPHLRFPSGREKRCVSDVASGAVRAVGYPPPTWPHSAAVRGREKRAVSDAAAKGPPRPQAVPSTPEQLAAGTNEEEEEEDTGGETIVYQPVPPPRLQREATIAEVPQSSKEASIPALPVMSWAAFRSQARSQAAPQSRPLSAPHTPTVVPVAYPTALGYAPAYIAPLSQYSAPVTYPAAPPVMYVQRAPERYRWDRATQGFVEGSSQYPALLLPVAAATQRPPFGTGPPRSPPPFIWDERGPAGPQPRPKGINREREVPGVPPPSPLQSESSEALSEGRRDVCDPHSFSAFLTAKKVNIPGDDLASRAAMMLYLEEYLSTTTPSYPKRHVRNAQRQLKMLQRRAQQDGESAPSQREDSGGGGDPDPTTSPQSGKELSTLRASAPPFVPQATA